MKMKKCSVCKKYTLKEICCKKPVISAHYKFIKVQLK
ncbi:MAG: hypothetical protein KKB21_03750 [Nanoarchaeota archaeon]|nr:hypothetical protein [Nanoarchaeota archaeon]MBU4086662.1 hypothetical protein [Nanoarchaeota archaeon]